MFLPILSLQNQLMKVTYAHQLLELNEKTKAYGLTLTEEDAKHGIEARSRTLKSYERIKLGINVTKRIVELLFLNSDYLYESKYEVLFSKLSDFELTILDKIVYYGDIRYKIENLYEIVNKDVMYD